MRQPTAGIDDQILVAEEVGDGMVAAAEALHPVAVGADLTVSSRGGTLPMSRDDERSVDLFLRSVPEGAAPEESRAIQEAVEESLLAEGWAEDDELSRGDGERWFLRAGDEGTVNGDGDSPGDWHVSVRDRQGCVQIDLKSPFGLRTGTQYDVEDLIEERHPEWRSPDGVLPR